MRSYWSSGGPLTQDDWCPYKKKEDRVKTDTEEDLVRTEAEIGEMQPQAKECLGLPGLEEARQASPLEALEGACLPAP